MGAEDLQLTPEQIKIKNAMEKTEGLANSEMLWLTDEQYFQLEEEELQENVKVTDKATRTSMVKEHMLKSKVGTMEAEGNTKALRVLIPSNAAPLERELMAGPPEGLSKAEKKQWEERLKSEIAAEKLKEQKAQEALKDYNKTFESTYQSVMTNFSEIGDTETATAEQYARSLQKTLNDIMPQKIEGAKNDFSSIREALNFKSGPKAKKLSNALHVLNSLLGVDLDANFDEPWDEQRERNDLNSVVSMGLAAYDVFKVSQGTLVDAQLSEIRGTIPEATLVFLFSSVSATIAELANDEEFKNIISPQDLARFRSLAIAAEMYGTTLYSSKQYHESVREQKMEKLRAESKDKNIARNKQRTEVVEAIKKKELEEEERRRQEEEAERLRQEKELEEQHKAMASTVAKEAAIAAEKRRLRIAEQRARCEKINSRALNVAFSKLKTKEKFKFLNNPIVESQIREDIKEYFGDSYYTEEFGKFTYRDDSADRQLVKDFNVTDEFMEEIESYVANEDSVLMVVKWKIEDIADYTAEYVNANQPPEEVTAVTNASQSSEQVSVEANASQSSEAATTEEKKKKKSNAIPADVKELKVCENFDDNFIEGLVKLYGDDYDKLREECAKNYLINMTEIKSWIDKKIKASEGHREDFRKAFVSKYGAMLYTSSYEKLRGLLVREQKLLYATNKDIAFNLTLQSEFLYIPDDETKIPHNYNSIGAWALKTFKDTGLEGCAEEISEAVFELAKEGYFKDCQIEGIQTKQDFENLAPVRVMAALKKVEENGLANCSQVMNNANVDIMKAMLSQKPEIFRDTVIKDEELHRDEDRFEQSEEDAKTVANLLFEKPYIFKYDELTKNTSLNNFFSLFTSDLESRQLNREYRLDRGMQLKDAMLRVPAGYSGTLYNLVCNNAISYFRTPQEDDPTAAAADALEELFKKNGDTDYLAQVNVFFPSSEAFTLKEIKNLTYEMILGNYKGLLAEEHSSIIKNVERAEYEEALRKKTVSIIEREEKFAEKIKKYEIPFAEQQLLQKRLAGYIYDESEDNADWEQKIERQIAIFVLQSQCGPIPQDPYYYSMWYANATEKVGTLILPTLDEGLWKSQSEDIAQKEAEEYANKCKLVSDETIKFQHTMELAYRLDIRTSQLMHVLGANGDKLMPFIQQNEDISYQMQFAPENAWNDYVKEFNAAMGPVNQALGNYTNMGEIYDQIVNKNLERITNLEEPHDLDYWSKVFSSTYSALRENKFYGPAIARIEAIKNGESFKDLKRFFDLVMETTPFSVFMKNEKFEDRMKMNKDLIVNNMKTFDEHLQKNFSDLRYAWIRDERKAAIRTTCFMYMRRSFLNIEINTQDIDRIFAYAVGMEDVTKQQTRDAEKIMEKRNRQFAKIRSSKYFAREQLQIEMLEYDRVQAKITAGKSPVVDALMEKTNAKGAIADEMWQEAREKIEECHFTDMTKERRELLEQVYVSNEAYREHLRKNMEPEIPDSDKLDKLLDIAESTIRAKLTDSKVPLNSPVTKQYINNLMSYIVASNINFTNPSMLEEIEAITGKKMEEFDRKQKVKATLTAFGKKLTSDHMLHNEYKKIAMIADYDIYTQSESEYRNNILPRVQYLENALQVYDLLCEKTQDKAEIAGLYQFFYHDINNSKKVDIEKMGRKVDAVLRDRDARYFVKDTTNALGKANEKSLDDSSYRQLFSTMDDNRFAYVLSNITSEEQKSKISHFGNEEIKLLGMILSFPQLLTPTGVKPGMDMVQNAVRDKLEMSMAQKAVSGYRHGDDFDYQVNYERALVTLTGHSHFQPMNSLKFDEEIFDKAVKFVEVCKNVRGEQQQESIIEYSKDPMISIALKHGKGHIIHAPKSVMDFGKVLNENKKGCPDECYEKIRKVHQDEHALDLLIRVLQNRAMVDYTSSISRFDRANGVVSKHIDEGGREEMFALAGTDFKEVGKISGAMIQKAFEQLYSYKLVEDCDYPKIEKERKTEIDFKLLEGAIDFVDELIVHEAKIRAIQNVATPQMIRLNKNKAANEALDEIQLAHRKVGMDQMTSDELNDFIIKMGKQDKQQKLMAGYLSLTDKEKELFFHALAHRDILDISKEGIWMNRFGYKEREYVNKEARFEAIDKFIEGSLPAASPEMSLYGLLSAQIDDTTNFAEERDLIEKGEIDYFSGRKTAIDWKLFARAIQLVKRAANEKQLMDGQETLYRKISNASENEELDLDMSLLRQNVHNSGTRFTRFLGRRVMDEVLDNVPGAALTAVRFMLPRGAQDYISELEPFGVQEKEEFEFTLEGLVSKGNDIAESLNETLQDEGKKGEIVTSILNNKLGEAVTESFKEHVETTSEVLGHANNALEAYSSVKSIYDLCESVNLDAAEQSEELNKKLAAEDEKVALYLKQRAQQGTDNVNMGAGDAVSRQVDKLINLAGDILGDVAEDASGAIAGILVKEAAHMICFIKNYVHDYVCLKSFFKMDNIISSYQDALKSQNIEGADKLANLTSDQQINFICDAYGFENFTEMSEVVGMNLTQSILFAASKYNQAQPRDRAVAQMVMKSLDMEDYIGDTSAEAAATLYKNLLGEER